MKSTEICAYAVSEVADGVYIYYVLSSLLRSSRLGQNQYMQYSLKPIPQFNHTITCVALGQDHTLALTKGGEVLSWGLNRFSQLGYAVEQATSGLLKFDEPIQTQPRKIPTLKKEIVLGVAASKIASACWTDVALYTWGTNHGQLGTYYANW